MLLSKDTTKSISRAQKTNTGSSIKSKLIGINDVLSKMLRGKYFIKSQGYLVKHNILLQNNKAMILLATNGTFSSSSKTKHIRSKFFLIKDKVDQGDIEVQYKCTECMWSDMLTKPRRGKAFCKFCGHLMNVPENYDNEVERLNTHPGLLLETRKKFNYPVLIPGL